MNFGLFTSGLCGIISLYREETYWIYMFYRAFITLNFIACIAVSSIFSLAKPVLNTEVFAHKLLIFSEIGKHRPNDGQDFLRKSEK